MVRLTLYSSWMWCCLANMCNTTHFLFIVEVKLSLDTGWKTNTYILWNMTWDAKKILAENLTDSLLDIICDVIDCFHMKTQFHSLPICHWTSMWFPSNEKNAVLLTFCWSWNKPVLWDCPAAKHCSVTHILLVMQWDMMRLLAANTVVSLTDCWYGMRCVKNARWKKLVSLTNYWS